MYACICSIVCGCGTYIWLVVKCELSIILEVVPRVGVLLQGKTLSPVGTEYNVPCSDCELEC